MAINIIKNKENPFFGRKEIIFTMTSNSTPTLKEIEELISKEFSTPIETIHVEKIKGNFGLKIFNILAYIYSSKEDKDKIVGKNKKKGKEKKKE